MTERIENPEKAHTMALAGDEARTDAVEARLRVKESEAKKRLDKALDVISDHEGASPWPYSQGEHDRDIKEANEDADYYDMEANNEEDEAGRQYDRENPPK